MHGWLVTHSLGRDTLLKLSSGWVDTHVTGNIDHVVGFDGLREGRKRRRSLGREHDSGATEGPLRAHIGADWMYDKWMC